MIIKSPSEDSKLPGGIKDFVEVLELAAKAKLPNLIDQRKTPTWRTTRELLDEGLLSEAEGSVGGTRIISDMTITPSGAIALAEWKIYLRENSWWYPIYKSFGRLFWISIGLISGAIGPTLTAGIQKWISV